MAAQRHDPAARATHVAQQQLEDRAGPDVLHAHAVLGPADAVDQRGGPLPAGVLRPRPADREEVLLGDAADLLDDLGGVAGVVPLEDLEDAHRVLQRLVARRLRADLHAVRLVLHAARGVALLGGVAGVVGLGAPEILVVVLLRELPARRVVRPRLGVEAGEQPVEVVDVLELVADDVRRVGVADDVLAEVQLVLQDVVDDPAEERDVAAHPDRDVLVRHGARPGEPRVDVDDPRAALLRLHHPLEAHRVGLGHVGALDDDAVGLSQVLLEPGGAATSEAGPQTGDGGGVSNTRLVLDLDGAHRGEELLDEVVLLVVQRRAAEAGDPHRAADLPAVLVDVLPAVLA